MKYEKMEKTQFFIGLYDKDSKKQEISNQKAMETIQEIANKYFIGTTVWLCNGIYKHIDGTTVCEPSIACLVYNAGTEEKQMFADKVKILLNQESLCIEETETNVCFY